MVVYSKQKRRHPWKLRPSRRERRRFFQQETVMKTMTLKVVLPALISLAFAGSAAAQIKVGVTVSATGPAASLGIPEKNTFTLLPKTIAGKSVEYIVLDDASDTTTAVRNARKL